MQLLQTPADRGYPAEYLLSRIRGRRSRLVRDWKPLIAALGRVGAVSSRVPDRSGRTISSEEIWRNLQQEHQWVYGQMNHEFRAMFLPFFTYVELKTVFICLRRFTGDKPGTFDELLHGSLLSDSVKEVLRSSAGQETAVSGLERVFLSLSASFSGLAHALETGGLREVERRLAEGYLAWAARARLHPLLKTFFCRLIDARNIMALSKHLRWERDAPLAVISGGSIPEARLRKAVQKADLTEAASIIHEATGVRPERHDAASVELALYRGMTQWLKKAGRDPSGAAPVLDYLWRRSIEAMNMSVLYHGQDLEPEEVAAELVV